MAVQPMQEVLIPNFGRVMVGALGGAAALATKYLGQDHDFVTRTLASGNVDEVWALGIGYCIVGPILLFLGGVIGFVANESSRLKLFAMGVAAPAMVTTWAGGSTPAAPADRIEPIGPAGFLQEFLPVSPAYAGEITVAQGAQVTRGVGLFFGVGKEEQRYWVIVGSHRDEADALAQAERINEAAPHLDAFVGKRAPGNPNYPVIIGEYLPLDAAKELQSSLAGLPGVDRAYLSAFADRR